MLDHLPALVGVILGFPVALGLIFLLVALGHGLGKVLTREN